MNQRINEPARLDALLAQGQVTIGTQERHEDASRLLAYVLGRERAWIVAHPEHEAPPDHVQEFARLCDRRATGIPVAYLLGHVGFYGHDFIVDESVLVPRPETEHLIDAAVGFIRKFNDRYPGRRPRFLDVGAGSGAVACAIAMATNANVEATEVSAPALSVALENARRLGVQDRCRFYRGDLTEPVRGQTFDVVVANLPYVRTGDLPRRPDPVAFEPRVALDGGSDGLALYRRLMPNAPTLLRPGALLLLEAAPPVLPGLVALVEATFGPGSASVGYDYGGKERYVAIGPL